MPCAAGGNTASNVVDIFNATTRTWSTAVLSLARYNFAATSLPNLGIAIFAGGGRKSCDVYLSCCMAPLLYERVGCMGAVCCFAHVLISDALRSWWLDCL